MNQGFEQQELLNLCLASFLGFPSYSKNISLSSELTGDCPLSKLLSALNLLEPQLISVAQFLNLIIFNGLEPRGYRNPALEAQYTKKHAQVFHLSGTTFLQRTHI